MARDGESRPFFSSRPTQMEKIKQDGLGVQSPSLLFVVCCLPERCMFEVEEMTRRKEWFVQDGLCYAMKRVASRTRETWRVVLPASSEHGSPQG